MESESESVAGLYHSWQLLVVVVRVVVVIVVVVVEAEPMLVKVMMARKFQFL